MTLVCVFRGRSRRQEHPILWPQEQTAAAGARSHAQLLTLDNGRGDKNKSHQDV